MSVQCFWSLFEKKKKIKMSQFTKLGVYTVVSVFRNYSILGHIGLIMALW